MTAIDGFKAREGFGREVWILRAVGRILLVVAGLAAFVAPCYLGKMEDDAKRAASWENDVAMAVQAVESICSDGERATQQKVIDLLKQRGLYGPQDVSYDPGRNLKFFVVLFNDCVKGGLLVREYSGGQIVYSMPAAEGRWR